MQAKAMIQAAATVLVLTAAASWASMKWDFNDNTAQGWLQTGGSAPAVQTWNGSPSIFTQIQNGSSEGNHTGSLYITGLSFTIDSTANYVLFSTLLTNNPAFDRSSYTLTLTTDKGNYDYQIDAGGANGGSTTLAQQVNLFALTKSTTSTPTMAVGDVVTGLNFHDWGYSFGMYADNIWLVPEPASLALLALGGCCLLRRRR